MGMRREQDDAMVQRLRAAILDRGPSASAEELLARGCALREEILAGNAEAQRAWRRAERLSRLATLRVHRDEALAVHRRQLRLCVAGWLVLTVALLADLYRGGDLVVLMVLIWLVGSEMVAGQWLEGRRIRRHCDALEQLDPESEEKDEEDAD